MSILKFELEIYAYNIDFNGHVSNIVYSEWMEIGRTKLLEAIAMPVYKIAQEGFVPVLVSTEISFKAPVHLGDRVSVELWVSELRHASAEMSFRFFKIDSSSSEDNSEKKSEEILVAIAKQKGIFADPDTMQPYRLKPDQKQKFATYLHKDLHQE
ncbi:putative thioesterase [Synechococcus sp. PCC 7502]|uniref:acyl-CoA thioesterase n=1 Tax=Synechococcus sp. PCC 7502 TaxID=1173263 RepID=UPI00029F85D0|nr:thioesterase family protein [Synechococcus sp. PCC 7502]AFY72979.1 putative thioesterase [Synechococcus sp. PCC 7502]